MEMQFVNASGQPWSPSAESMAKKPKPKAKGEALKEWHKGWDVVGHEPGACERARLDTEGARAQWFAMDDRRRARAEKGGKREPAPWNEEEWRAKAPKKRLRSRPFQAPQAAADMAELAKRSGWEDVEVQELAKIDPEAEAERRAAGM